MDHLYYRRNNRKRSVQRKSKNNKNYSLYLYPFLAVIGIVLISNLFSFISNVFSSSESPTLENAFIVASLTGNVSSVFDDFNSNLSLSDPILVGTDVIVPKNSALVVETDSGELLRFDESSNFTYKAFDKENSIYELELKSGRVWVNSQGSLNSIKIISNYIDLISKDSIISYKANLPETLNVFDGQSLVVLKDDKDLSEIDRFMFESSTSMNLDNNQYQEFVNGNIGNIKTKTTSDVYLSNWYKWNTFYDNNQVSYSFEDLFTAESKISLNQISNDIDTQNTLQDLNVDQIDKSTTPYFTYPNDAEVITDERIKMFGKVPSGVVKVVITSYNEDGNSEPYVLKEFEANTEDFVYYAFYDTERGNLFPGINKFDVKGILSDGSETPSSSVEFVFRDPNKVIDVDLTEDDSSLQDTSESVDPISSDNDEVNVNTSNNDSFDPIVIKTINDIPFTNDFVLDTGRAFIVGEVPNDVTKVRINGFDLTMFEKGSTTFHYILSDGFKNLKEGENILKIQYEKNGVFSPSFSLKVIYNPS